MNEINNMTEKEKEILLLLKQKILEAHQEGIKRRKKLENGNNSGSKPWFKI